MYAGMKVIDDTHQNPGTGWNGDTVQVMFSQGWDASANSLTGDIGSTGGLIEYNYGISTVVIASAMETNGAPSPRSSFPCSSRSCSP
jgi:hypothetical protein